MNRTTCFDTVLFGDQPHPQKANKTNRLKLNLKNMNFFYHLLFSPLNSEVYIFSRSTLKATLSPRFNMTSHVNASIPAHWESFKTPRSRRGSLGQGSHSGGGASPTARGFGPCGACVNGAVGPSRCETEMQMFCR